MRILASLFLLSSVTLNADSINMDDPRRAVGREDDIRIDAKLARETVAPGAAVGVVYQIHNLTATAVAVADKVASASYDSDTRTIEFSIGSEVPEEMMPHVTIVAPGETKLLRASAVPSLNAAARGASLGGTPRYVQVKVSILRDLAPFRALIDQQAKGPQPLSDALFDQWFESNDTILLNALPVQFNGITRDREFSAENRSSRGTF